MTDFVTLTGRPMRDMNKLKELPVEATPTPFPTWNRMCRDEGGGVGLPGG